MPVTWWLYNRKRMFRNRLVSCQKITIFSLSVVHGVEYLDQVYFWEFGAYIKLHSSWSYPKNILCYFSFCVSVFHFILLVFFFFFFFYICSSLFTHIFWLHIFLSLFVEVCSCIFFLLYSSSCVLLFSTCLYFSLLFIADVSLFFFFFCISFIIFH